MGSDNYRNLQEYLDSFGLGFPAAKSGIEIDVLKELFTEEEAEMFLNVRNIPETPLEVAERINSDPVSVGALLDRMAGDGLLFSIGQGAEKKYMVAPFLLGIYENKAHVLTEKVARLMDDYLNENYRNYIGETLRKTSFLRVIPVERSVEFFHTVSSYDRNRELIRSKDRIAVAKCICRSQKDKIGMACDKPTETCMVFDWYADYFVENKQGRAISKEEALEIQDRCEELGLVSLGSNIADMGIVLCHCCGCCCMSLTSAKKLPRPVETFVSNYYAAVNSDLCTGCEVCLDRCQMEAISIVDEVAAINRDRCIGCGVCVPACPTGAMEFLRKPELEAPINTLEASAKR
ncbi:MAG: DUF362 domain-containing protein [Syntrophobacteraceae bacterium]